MEAQPENEQIKRIPVSQLQLDPENPRLPKEVDGSDEKAVLEWMLQEGNGNLPELMASIVQQGFFPGEPLLVTQGKGNSYIVVEGNRRLASVKLLLEPSKATAYTKTVNELSRDVNQKQRLDQLPVIIYPKREDILKYLGYRHVTGVKTWSALAKAKYLKQLFEAEAGRIPDEQQRLRELAKGIGSRANNVAKLLAGLKVYEKIEQENFFNIKGLTEGEVDFSLLTTALSYENIYAYIGLTKPTDLEQAKIKDLELKKLTKWIFEKNTEGATRLGESRKLKELNAVIGNSDALEQFDKHSLPLKEAEFYTGIPLERFRLALSDARRHIKTANDVLTLLEDGFDDGDKQAVDVITKLIKTTGVILNGKLAELTETKE